MSAKCSECGLKIYDEDGQCYGTQLVGGSWVCDDDCELGLSLKPDPNKIQEQAGLPPLQE